MTRGMLSTKRDKWPSLGVGGGDAPGDLGGVAGADAVGGLCLSGGQPLRNSTLSRVRSLQGEVLEERWRSLQTRQSHTLVTTLPAPIVVPRPILTPPRIVTLPPMKTSSSMTTTWPRSVPLMPFRLRGSVVMDVV